MKNPILHFCTMAALLWSGSLGASARSIPVSPSTQPTACTQPPIPVSELNAGDIRILQAATTVVTSRPNATEAQILASIRADLMMSCTEGVQSACQGAQRSDQQIISIYKYDWNGLGTKVNLADSGTVDALTQGKKTKAEIQAFLDNLAATSAPGLSLPFNNDCVLKPSASPSMMPSVKPSGCADLPKPIAEVNESDAALTLAYALWNKEFEAGKIDYNFLVDQANVFFQGSGSIDKSVNTEAVVRKTISYDWDGDGRLTDKDAALVSAIWWVKDVLKLPLTKENIEKIAREDLNCPVVITNPCILPPTPSPSASPSVSPSGSALPSLKPPCPCPSDPPCPNGTLVVKRQAFSSVPPCTNGSAEDILSAGECFNDCLPVRCQIKECVGPSLSPSMMPIDLTCGQACKPGVGAALPPIAPGTEGPDSFNLDARSTGFIEAGAGDDNFNYSGASIGALNTFLIGGAGSDSLVVPDATAAEAITALKGAGYAIGLRSNGFALITASGQTIVFSEVENIKFKDASFNITVKAELDAFLAAVTGGGIEARAELDKSYENIFAAGAGTGGGKCGGGLFCSPTENVCRNPQNPKDPNCTTNPVVGPTLPPTVNPTVRPTINPTLPPTVNPTLSPTANPTVRPTVNPTVRPTVNPTLPPTANPTVRPTVNPTLPPTVNPTLPPTANPTVRPTVNPTLPPTVNPTLPPTVNPTLPPTVNPTLPPTANPTLPPTANPTLPPTANPTLPPTIPLNPCPCPPAIVCPEGQRLIEESFFYNIDICRISNPNPAECFDGCLPNPNCKRQSCEQVPTLAPPTIAPTPIPTIQPPIPTSCPCNPDPGCLANEFPVGKINVPNSCGDFDGQFQCEVSACQQVSSPVPTPQECQGAYRAFILPPGSSTLGPNPISCLDRNGSISNALALIGRTIIVDKNCNILITDENQFDGTICGSGSYVTPISLVFSEMMETPAVVDFALNPSTPGFSLWRASESLPLLVIDPTHSGNITSAEQLFGNFTAGKNWTDGYQALASFDIDKDGKVSANELSDLALWFDKNRNGLSEAGEVQTLAEAGITALFYGVSSVDSQSGDLHASIGYERTLNNQTIIGKSLDWYEATGFTSRNDALAYQTRRASAPLGAENPMIFMAGL